MSHVEPGDKNKPAKQKHGPPTPLSGVTMKSCVASTGQSKKRGKHVNTTICLLSTSCVVYNVCSSITIILPCVLRTIHCQLLVLYRYCYISIPKHRLSQTRREPAPTLLTSHGHPARSALYALRAIPHPCLQHLPLRCLATRCTQAPRLPP